MQLKKQQRIFFVRSFDTSNNVTGVVRAYQEHFQGRSVSRVTVRRTIAKFCSHGTILNRNKGNSGRLVTKRTPENIQLVHQQIEEHEGVSTRRNELDLSRSTIQRIIKKDLKYYPYKPKVSQELLEGDYDRRATLCGWLLIH